MGLFGGSFATGLASGLATSVGETISDDRSRREARLDKLRTFYETRQVQEQDRAKAEDDRTRKHLERLKREANVSAAEVVAMYKGIGGTNDALDNHFNIVDQNKALGRTFDYTDMLKNSGMDFSQYGNFTMQDAFDNFKYEISDVDVNYKEAPGFLAAIGLGQDEDKISASITEGVRGLVPSVSRKDSGIGSMAVPEGFYGQTMMAEKAKRDTMILDIKERVVFMQDAFSDAKNALAKVEENEDNLTGEEFKNALKEAASNLKTAEENLEENKNLYKWMESSKLSAEELVSLTARRDGYRQEKDALLGAAGIDVKGDGMSTTARVMEEYKYTDPNGQEQVATEGTKISGAAAVEYKEKKLNEFNRKYTIENLVDSNGDFIERTARLMFTDTGGLGLIPYNTYTNVIKGMGVVDTDNETGAVVNETPVFTLEQAQEQIADLDIPSMTQEAKEAKKADIIFNATRGVKTPAEFEAVRKQLEEIFVATGLSKAPDDKPAEPAEGAVELKDIDKAKAIADEMINEPQKFLSGLIENKGRVLTNKEEETLRSQIRELYLEANPRASQMEAGRFASEVFKTYRASDQYTAQLQKDFDSLTQFEKINQWESYRERGVDTGYLGLTQEQAAERAKREAEQK